MVGKEVLKLLEKSNIKIKELRLFASRKSINKKVKFRNKYYRICELNYRSFKGLDFVLFLTPSHVSRIWAPLGEKEGCIVIDNSSFFRMNEEIPLIIPEVNLNDINWKRRIISNPNCSTIQSVIALNNLNKEFRIKSIRYTTYQSVSGMGNNGIKELRNCINKKRSELYRFDISKNTIPEIDEPLDNNYTKEEMKMINETRKILAKNEILISSTCVRVPIERCHAVVINVEFEKEVTVEAIKRVLKEDKNIVIRDDIMKHIYPLQEEAYGSDLVYVGRIRKDLASSNGIILYVVADNVLRGAASNLFKILSGIINKEDNMYM